MTKLDYLLAIAAVITFVLAASVLASLYVNNKSNQSTKKADILDEINNFKEVYSMLKNNKNSLHGRFCKKYF